MTRNGLPATHVDVDPMSTTGSVFVDVYFNEAVGRVPSNPYIVNLTGHTALLGQEFSIDEKRGYDGQLPSDLELLRMPEDIDPNNEALQEMLPALRKRFGEYWSEQCVRIEAAGGIVVGSREVLTDREEARVTRWQVETAARERAKAAEQGREIPFEVKSSKRPNLVDTDTRQDRFEGMVRMAYGWGNRIVAAKEGHPDRKAVSMLDVDDTLGITPHDVVLPSTKGEDSMSGSEKQAHREHLEALQYEAMVLNPAVEVVVNWSHERYGDGVAEGILTTKHQKGLDEILVPKLQERCPDGFTDPKLIISMTNGRFNDLIKPYRDVIDSQNKKDADGKRSKSSPVSMQQLLASQHQATDADGVITQVIPDEFRLLEESLDLEHEDFLSVSDEDLKFLITVYVEYENRGRDYLSGDLPYSIISIDNWPPFEHVKPDTSTVLQAFPIRRDGAQFYIPEMGRGIWGSKGQAHIGFANIDFDSIDL